ncbi:MAG: hypothetical protein AB1705_09910 [Verrucomicrobiota bacterium]
MKEFTWDQPEAFTLVTETTTDGERVVKEKIKRESDRAESEQRQVQFNYETNETNRD